MKPRCCDEFRKCLHIEFTDTTLGSNDEVIKIKPGYYLVNDETDAPMYSSLHYCPWCGAKI